MNESVGRKMTDKKTLSFSDEKKEMEEENVRSSDNSSKEHPPRSTYEKFKQAITPDKNFLPLKMTW